MTITLAFLYSISRFETLLKRARRRNASGSCLLSRKLGPRTERAHTVCLVFEAREFIEPCLRGIDRVWLPNVSYVRKRSLICDAPPPTTYLVQTLLDQWDALLGSRRKITFDRRRKLIIIYRIILQFTPIFTRSTNYSFL